MIGAANGEEQKIKAGSGYTRGAEGLSEKSLQGVSRGFYAEGVVKSRGGGRVAAVAAWREGSALR